MSKKLIDALNQARADELAVIIQYMGHHYMGQGMESAAILDVLKEVAITEMKHAEALGERINYLGGEPTQKPSPIKSGGTLKKMIKDNLDSENAAIANYRRHIELAIKEGDTTTRTMLEGILADEEGHADQFKTLLGLK